MKVRFWGTRGSLPVAQKAGAIQAKIAACHATGGETTTIAGAIIGTPA